MKTYVEWFCFLFIIVCVKNVEEVTWLGFNELHYNERYTCVMICSQTKLNNHQENKHSRLFSML